MPVTKRSCLKASHALIAGRGAGVTDVDGGSVRGGLLEAASHALQRQDGGTGGAGRGIRPRSVQRAAGFSRDLGCEKHALSDLAKVAAQQRQE